jgi:hypothetical protein
VSRFLVKGARRSVGENTTEGSFDSLDAAVARIQELKDDEDCVLAEVGEWSSVAESLAAAGRPAGPKRTGGRSLLSLFVRRSRLPTTG